MNLPLNRSDGLQAERCGPRSPRRSLRRDRGRTPFTVVDEHPSPTLLDGLAKTPADIDGIGLNEASASRTVAVIRDAKLDPEKINPFGRSRTGRRDDVRPENSLWRHFSVQG